MGNQSFKHYINQALVGLRSDPELMLVEKQKLESNLWDKTAEFIQQGHSETDSIKLACELFGSPIDLAVEIENTNKKHLRYRSRLRLLFGLIIIPIALVFALYVGYMRFVRFHGVYWITSGVSGINTYLRDMCTEKGYPSPLAHQLRNLETNAPNVYRYWKAHRQDPNSYIYYAYYVLMLDLDDNTYEDAFKTGEQIEPQNALYNLLLADCYLKRAISHDAIYGSPRRTKLEVTDHKAFEQGIAQIIKAAKKPYLHAYYVEVVHKKLQSLPHPVLLEDYTRYIAVSDTERIPHYHIYGDVAHQLPFAAELLLLECRTDEATALMDAWKPLTRLMLHDTNFMELDQYMLSSSTQALSRGAATIYNKLGLHSKSREAKIIYDKLVGLDKEWKKDYIFLLDGDCESCAQEACKGIRYSSPAQMLRQHGGIISANTVPLFKNMTLNDRDLKPSRMFENVYVEEIILQLLLTALALAMLGAFLQTGMWLLWLRREKSVPLMLLPSLKELASAVLLGIFIPATVYWIYTRILPIGGRDFGWLSGMALRFLGEMSVVAVLMFCIPVCYIQNIIRKRMNRLGIPGPLKRNETITTWIVRFASAISVFIIAAYWYCSEFVYSFCQTALPLRISGLVLAAVIPITAIWLVKRKRSQYDLYYSTLARSMVPVYAIVIFCISFTLQPLLMVNEANWLKQDNLYFKYYANKSPNTVIMMSRIEQQLAERYSTQLYQALYIKGIK